LQLYCNCVCKTNKGTNKKLGTACLCSFSTQANLQVCGRHNCNCCHCMTSITATIRINSDRQQASFLKLVMSNQLQACYEQWFVIICCFPCWQCCHYHKLGLSHLCQKAAATVFPVRWTSSLTVLQGHPCLLPELC